MSQANPQADLIDIFNQIDKDKDGFISRADLQESGYAELIFQKNENALLAFNTLHNKMNQKQFQLLANAYTYKLHDLAIVKFQIAKNLAKYLTVSAPGEAGPSIKQSYMKLCAHNQSFLNNKQHKIGIELGIDKPKQQQTIKEITQALGHPPHQVFLLLKLRTKQHGQQIAESLGGLLNDIVLLLQQLAPQFQIYMKTLRIKSKYYDGYIYLVIQVDNPFLDNIIAFFNELIQAISSDFCLKFKAQLKSNLKYLLKDTFDFEKSGGQINLQFDIDSVTLRKIKQIIGDNIEQNIPIQFIGAMALMLEELKISAKFDNLAQALTSALQIPAQNFPKPSNFLNTIKELQIKQTIGQFFEKAPQFIDKIKDNCQFQGFLSLNFRDFFLKVNFDLQIQEAFDLL